VQAAWDYSNEEVHSQWSTREQAENLQLVPVFVGESNGECWWCLDRNSSTGDCMGDSSNGGIILSFWSCMWVRFASFAAMSHDPYQIYNLAMAPEYEAPSFAVLDILAVDPRYVAVTIDGSEPICVGELGSIPPIASLLVPYMGKVRLVVSPSLAPDQFHGSSLDIEIVKAEICNLNQTGSLTLPLKLVPGPSVHFMFNISKDPDSALAEKLKNRFCNLLWPEAYYADRQERCSFQLFLQIAQLQVTMTVLMQSNGHATRARLLINEEFYKSEFIAEFGVVWSANSASVHAPSTFGLGKSQTWGAKAKLDMSSNHGCFTHEDCEDGMFCSTNTLRDPSTFIGWFGCDPCQYCFRDSDAADGACPRDRCGDLAGRYPLCLDAVPFLRGFECKSKFQLNMSLVRDDETIPSDLLNQSTPTGKLGKEMKEKTKARFLTPFNRLIGAIMITQERSSTTVACTVQNQRIQNFSNSGRGTVCRSDTLDSSPFGVDPAFSISSALYAGDFAPEDFYTITERSRGKDGSPGAPYGFFPVNYSNRMFRNGSVGEVETQQRATGSNVTASDSSGNHFKLYFDERIESAHAQNMLTYMIDGSFLDDRTSKVKVEMNTLNVQLNMIATFEFIFDFQVYTVQLHSFCRVLALTPSELDARRMAKSSGTMSSAQFLSTFTARIVSDAILSKLPL
jgi:hypothetical protein